MKKNNRDGGNGCSNPNWGTGKRGDANPDTQKELTVLQKNNHICLETNPLENPECFASILPCSGCDKAILIPEIKEQEKQKCILCGGKYELFNGGCGLLPGIVIPLVRIIPLSNQKIQ